MYQDIIEAHYLYDYKIKLFFENGKSGVVDFRKFIEKGGVFCKLADYDVFKRFGINRETGVITWEDDIDIAPETLYSEATGEPLPSWIEKESVLSS
ncbi:DUF2442 domain-containing protein [candidate division KSB1 bacterium]|nr:MAG: DUF2442 domain-containing protein [candidate division KSB1 bacterium]